jgi:hypothetical protein
MYCYHTFQLLLQYFYKQLEIPFYVYNSRGIYLVKKRDYLLNKKQLLIDHYPIKNWKIANYWKMHNDCMILRDAQKSLDYKKNEYKSWVDI